MTRARTLAVTACAVLAAGCGKGAADSGDEDASFVPRHLVPFHACVVTYFDQVFTTVQEPAPRWTIGVADHPEIGTAVTGDDGCTDILLPARSRLLVTATKPGWVPNALTLLTGDVAPPPMHPRVLESFTGLPPDWWAFTAAAACDPGAPDGGETSAADTATGMVATVVSSSLGLLAPVEGAVPVLRPEGGRARTDWLYVGPAASSYCNSKTVCPTCDCCSTGQGTMPSVLPGLAEMEVPGLTCIVDPAKGAYAWPSERSPGTFEVDVRPGYFTNTALECHP